ncbi:MAG: RNA polymerase sigma factor [Arenicella sp.]|nr:RNA polymerase sigma factor [Arenicella sp.]
MKSVSGNNEAELIELAKSGDLKAYEQLYRKHVGKIHALCLRLTGQTELAEDMTQESFIRAWQKLGSFRGDSAFSSWLYRLSSNVAIGYLRQQNKWRMVSFEESHHQATIGFASIHEEAPDLEKTLMKLPDQARTVVILHEHLGYKHAEIAQLTGIAVGTSKSLLSRAKALIQNN